MLAILKINKDNSEYHAKSRTRVEIANTYTYLKSE